MVYLGRNDPTKVLSQHVFSLQSLADAAGIRLTIIECTPFATIRDVDYKYLTEFIMLMGRVIDKTRKNGDIYFYPYGLNKENQEVWCSVESKDFVDMDIDNLTNGFDINVLSYNPGQFLRIDILYPPLDSSIALKRKSDIENESQRPFEVIKPFYQKLREQLKSHFTSIESLEESAKKISTDDGNFLKQVNNAILINIDNIQFDALALSRILTLSRSQLYRKLKPLARRSPAAYIKYIRLMKAKDKLEKTNSTIGDIAYEVGYPDQSHFTRSFKNQFGYHPSYYRKQCEKTIELKDITK